MKTFEFLIISTNLSEHFSLIEIKKKNCENANAEQLINAPIENSFHGHYNVCMENVETFICMIHTYHLGLK